MRRKFLASFPFITAIFPGLAAQTQVNMLQIKPNLVIFYENLTLNPATRTLTLSSTPAGNFLQLFINGLQVRPVRDYTISGTTITLVPFYNTLDPTSYFDAYYYK